MTTPTDDDDLTTEQICRRLQQLPQSEFIDLAIERMLRLKAERDEWADRFFGKQDKLQAALKEVARLKEPPICAETDPGDHA